MKEKTANIVKDMTPQGGLFMAACFIYGLFSSPTPDQPGLAESLVALCLAGAAGLTIPAGLLSGAILFDEKEMMWRRIGNGALLYLLLVPALTGLLNGQPAGQMLRDIAPMLFLFLPILLRHETWPQKILPAVLCFIGIAFSIRYFMIIGILPWHIGRRTFHDNFLYLPLSPEVLFTALAFVAIGVGRFMRKSRVFLPDLTMALISAFISLVCFAALTGLLLRASLILGIGAAFFIALKSAPRAPLRFLIMMLLAVTAAFSFPKPIDKMTASLTAKNFQFGLNERDTEFSAATAMLFQDPVTAMVGEGWGAHIISPAVGNLRVPYTHNFISYMLVKTGVTGTILTFAYLLSLMPFFIEKLKNNFDLSLGAMLCFLLSLTLYTSYKYFGFGLILLYLTSSGHDTEFNPVYQPRPA